MATCNNCDDYTCVQDLDECLSTVRLGRISLLSTNVYVHIEKQNGAAYIQGVTSTAGGFVDISMSLPSSSFFNAYDGAYKIYIMQGGYFANVDRLTVTAPGGTYTTALVSFRKNAGVAYTTQHIQI